MLSQRSVLTSILILSSSWSICAAAQAAELDSCSALIGTCEYYSCIENERLSCGEGGYPIDYGLNYCEKLSAIEFYPARTSLGARTFPADGNAWRDGVRTCLQNEMEDYFKTNSNVTCEGLKQFAFNSHPICYTSSISFCELTVESVLKVGFTLSTQDLFANESVTQIAATARICSEQLSTRMKKEYNPLVYINLKKYQLIWNAISKDPDRFQNELGGADPVPEPW